MSFFLLCLFSPNKISLLSFQTPVHHRMRPTDTISPLSIHLPLATIPWRILLVLCPSTPWTKLKNRANSQAFSVFSIQLVILFFQSFILKSSLFFDYLLDFSLFYSFHLSFMINKSLTYTAKDLYGYFVKFKKNFYLHWIYEIYTYSFFSPYLTYPGARKNCYHGFILHYRMIWYIT